MSRYSEILSDKYEQFLSAEEGVEQSKIVQEIAEVEANLSELTSIDYHMLGLVYYHLAENAEDICKAHKYFLRSLDLSPNYGIARLYSAHCYHDVADYTGEIDTYRLALDEYSNVNAKNLKVEFPIWRFIKLQEQIGYCHHKLGSSDESNKYFEIVLSYYMQEKYDELVDPVEIYKCLDEDSDIYKQLKTIEKAYYTE